MTAGLAGGAPAPPRHQSAPGPGASAATGLPADSRRLQHHVSGLWCNASLLGCQQCAATKLQEGSSSSRVGQRPPEVRIFCQIPGWYLSTSDRSGVRRGSTASSMPWWTSLLHRSVRPVTPLSRIQFASCMPPKILRIIIQQGVFTHATRLAIKRSAAGLPGSTCSIHSPTNDSHT